MAERSTCGEWTWSMELPFSISNPTSPAFQRKSCGVVGWVKLNLRNPEISYRRICEPMKVLLQKISFTVLTAALLLLIGDWIVFEVRLAHGTAFDSVHV